MSGQLEGKVAIVTGGASGIGAATVERFVEEGAKVLSTDVEEALGQQVADEAGALFMAQDVSDAQSWDAVMAKAQGEFGRLDILVNNAGIVIGKNIEDVDLDSWYNLLGINLTGVMLGCQKAIAVMKVNPGGSSGSIINIASTSAFAALPGDVTYTASKSAVRMLSKSVAVHCAQSGLNIRCNNLVPGATHTGIIDTAAKSVPGMVEMAAAMSPLNRIGQGSDLAAAAVYLASDDSSFVTGSDLLVDGGMLAVHPGY
ncbi:SDR family NAD(P)-dependent oxidoreductase [Sphingorhabdus sp. SMR4y]|uniref:SDR family NAD(P)-dependent oxidoreductase n=1 Tax=Sphingorhabdus sp. SMR4y TaxID=2584094 RepID=UPI000B5C5B75|nr:SDR family oxidoreductase [Sphingorhabdus sp. SMR4y]ASK88684.1 1,6-dihydroxycyclohexa-2,4-diene-1-carboxylate dehydrogenase [Sphingorhabdus sp. SMR4y]